MKTFFIQVAAIFLSTFAVAVASVALLKVEETKTVLMTTTQDERQLLTKLLLSRVKACVNNAADVSHKDELFSLVDALDQHGYVKEWGSDAMRVKYVYTQGSIEHVLACAMVLGEVDSLVGIIHTPTPATPLCTKVDKLDEQLLDPSIRYDLEKLLTVRSRAVIVREYLENGGKLFVAYPKGGLEKRSEEQQAVYCEELIKYAGRLFDAVLSCNSMDPEKVGATYFFRDQKGDIFVFSIKATQVNHPLAESEWGMWFGKSADTAINERVNVILDYLNENGGPDIKRELEII